MKDELRYLDDIELERLIADVEQNELVKAPDRIEQNVLRTIHAKERKVHEFRRYCLQVGLSVAAAVALLVITPFVPFAKREVPVKPELPSKEAVVESYGIASREEVMARYNRDLKGDLKQKVAEFLDDIGGLS